MANWYFYDQNGYKIGPIKGRELKQSAQQGLITPETVVEDENGRTALAKQVTGLMFSETAQPKVVPQVSDNPSTIAAPLPSDQPISVPLPAANGKIDAANLAASGNQKMRSFGVIATPQRN